MISGKPTSPRNIITTWRWLSLFQLTLLIHLILYILSPDVGNSTQFHMLAIGLFVQAMVVFTMTISLPKLLISTWIDFFMRFRLMYVAVALVIVFVFGILIRPEWVYAHAGLALCASLGLVYITFFADDTLSVTSIPFVLIAIGIGVIFTLIRINALAVYPHIIPTDEPWLLGWPLAWVRGVYPDDLLFFHGGEDVFHYFVPMGIWMQVVGTGFVQGRVYQLLMTLVLMGVAVPLVKRLYDKQTAWLTVLMLFGSSVTVLATTIRHDIGLAILLTASFLVYRIAVDKNDNRLHFVAGLIVGLGLFTHYHTIAFGPVLMIALYVPYYVRDFKQRGWMPQREVIYYALGGLLGAGIVFLVQILPQLDAVIGVREFRSAGGWEFVKSYFEYFAVLSELSQFEFLLIIGGMAGLLYRRTIIDIQVLLMILLGHLGLALLAAQITLEYYVIPLAPFYAIAVITLLTRTIKGLAIKQVGWIALFFVVANLGFTLSTPIKYTLDGKTLEDVPAPQGIAWIKDNVPVGSRIVGDIYYYLWLTDYEFYAATSDRYVSSEYRDAYESPADLWRDANPDYLIFDPNIPSYDMQRVLDSGFLDNNPDYEIVTQFAGRDDKIIIYGRTDSD